VTPFANRLGPAALALVAGIVLFAVVAHFLSRRASGRWGGAANLRVLSLLPSQESDLVRRACLWGALVLTAVAFARPQWGEVAENIQRVGLDVVVLLDTSRSMGVQDSPPTRLERAKLEVRSLLSATEGNRTALVAFAGVPVVLSPLTEDSAAVGMLLDISDPDLIPALGTDIAKGVADAARLFPQPHDRDQVILLVTDGEDQGKDALAAARTAARLGIRIFAVGVGTEGGGPVPGPDGRPMTDPATGSPAVSRLDEKLLAQMASITDGRYWKLAGAGSVVPQVVEEMGRLKRKEYATRSQAMRQDQYALFLGPALALLAVALLIPDRRRLAALPKGKGKGPAIAVAATLALLALRPVATPAQSVSQLAQTANAAYVSGHPDTALLLYQRALQQASSPDLKPLLHFNVGTCLLALDRPVEARDELTQALPGAAPLVKERALYNLAQSYHAAGDRSRALQTLRTLLVDSPEDRDADRLYEWILRQQPPEPPPPQKQPPNPPPKAPDVLEQLPMPPPKELQDQVKPPDQPPPGMKPW
jgi:Ca-activated chloride channel homolog